MVDSLLGSGKGPSNRKSARLARTILLGTVAVAVAVYWVADSYGVDRQNLLENLQTSAAFVALFVGIGIAAGGLLWGLRLLIFRLRQAYRTRRR